MEQRHPELLLECRPTQLSFFPSHWAEWLHSYTPAHTLSVFSAVNYFKLLFGLVV